jgi:hypothetical protein
MIYSYYFFYRTFGNVPPDAEAGKDKDPSRVDDTKPIYEEVQATNSTQWVAQFNAQTSKFTRQLPKKYKRQ